MKFEDVIGMHGHLFIKEKDILMDQYGYTLYHPNLNTGSKMIHAGFIVDNIQRFKLAWRINGTDGDTRLYTLDEDVSIELWQKSSTL